MEMKILGNRILIEPTEPIRQMPSGLFLPETVLQKPNTGTVVIVGEKADKSLLGKKVLYNPIIATEIDGKHLVHILEIKFIYLS
jgi:co-chaperonin GroES (HSP10)